MTADARYWLLIVGRAVAVGVITGLTTYFGSGAADIALVGAIGAAVAVILVLAVTGKRDG
jgi:hypothetical protein